MQVVSEYVQYLDQHDDVSKLRIIGRMFGSHHLESIGNASILESYRYRIADTTRRINFPFGSGRKQSIDNTMSVMRSSCTSHSVTAHEFFTSCGKQEVSSGDGPFGFMHYKLQSWESYQNKNKYGAWISTLSARSHAREYWQSTSTWMNQVEDQSMQPYVAKLKDAMKLPVKSFLFGWHLPKKSPF